MQQIRGPAGMPGEEFKDHHRIGFHGFGYNPPKGAHAVGLSMHGRRDRALILGLEHQEKRQKNIPTGGACLYDASGNIIKAYGDNGGIEFGSNPFVIKCGTFTVEASEIVLKGGGMVVRIRSGRIDLGAMVASNRVVTEAGPSNKVYAEI